MPVDGTTRVMQCSIHNFETEDPLKWYVHLDDEGHFEVGHSICAVCGGQVAVKREDNVPSKLFLNGKWTHKECRQ
jgi:hypothetical protein